MATSSAAMTEFDGVGLTATFRLVDEHVEVELTVNNTRTENVYLTDFDLDPKTGGLRPCSLLVRYEEPNTVVLWRYLVPLDPSIQWASPPTAYVSRIAPNESYRTRVRAPAPLRVPNVEPDRVRRGVGTVVECTTVRFELGVIFDAPQLRPRELTIAGKVMYAVNALAVQYQKIMALETRELRVPLFIS